MSYNPRTGGRTIYTRPGDKGVDLKLNAGKIKTSSINNFSGSVEEDKVDGKLNNGGVPVKINAGNGKINLVVVK
ncbi:MAG: hypothetical protein ACXWC7_04605 [Chitinophagaceae bacterium]